MFKRSKLFVTFLLLAALVLGVSGCSSKSSSAYPQKEVRIIVPYKAGGQSDLTARKIADIIQKKKLLSKPVVVVNMPAGNTLEGIKNVKDSKADGHTLLLHHTAFLTMKALGQMDMSYKDFDMIGQALEMPFVIVARNDAKWSNIEEALDDAKQNPDKITMGVAGFGGAGHFALLHFLNATDSGSAFKVVPFSGGAEATTSQLGGHTDLRLANTLDAMRYVKSGDLKVLVSLTLEKSPDFPEAMTLKDLGVEEDMILRNGLFAPKSTPDEVKDKLSGVLKDVLGSDEFKEFAKSQGANATFMDGDQWVKAFENDDKLVTELAKTVEKE